jgi:arginyl-tRNA synthetase
MLLTMSDLGDWGKQYGLLALAYNMYGDEEALKRDPIDHLFRLYVRISAEKETEKEEIEAQKKEGKDVSALEAKCLDEQARQYFRKMVRQCYNDLVTAMFFHEFLMLSCW